jgi:error-prone DNA polymerase
MVNFAELVASTNFSFLRGAAHPQEMVLHALLLGMNGIGIADCNTVAGVVRAHCALMELRVHGLPPLEKLSETSRVREGALIDYPLAEASPLTCEEVKKRARAFRLAVGARLIFVDGTPDIVAYPSNRTAWGRLCRLLSLGNRRAKKGECILYLEDLLAAAEGLLLILVPPRRLDMVGSALCRLREAALGATWLGAAMHHRGDDRRRLARLKMIADAAGVPLLAMNDALYDTPTARDLQDILTCIREGVTIDRAGRLLEANAERHLKPPAEMVRLFRDAPEAVFETQSILSRINFSLSDLRYDYPEEPVPPGWQADDWLAKLTWGSAAIRYPAGIPEKVKKLLGEELALIRKLDYARYFLTIFDIVRVAQDKGILCQGRGSAANSAVCYMLGITAVNPAEHDLLFVRFISEGRHEPPDIDVDFEHERREEIIQYIYGKYGRERAGIAATVISYRPRSAMRDVGKALGMTKDITARLASTQWGSWGLAILDEHVRGIGLDPANPIIHRALMLARRLLGFPRHLSQHVGGFVLTRGRLDELVPIGNAAMAGRTFIEWDKDDIDALGLMKIDVLALGMLTCIRKSFDLMRTHGLGDYALHDIPSGDSAVYNMLCNADSLGVFQVESRAQMNMLPRLKPREFYDLVIQVAIVRPGPIQGGMVHPYLRRRTGLEQVAFPAPSPKHGLPSELWQLLNKTHGVPLFQEQAMKVAMVAAQFSDTESNHLRRAMATFRNIGKIGMFEILMIERMVERGYPRDFAVLCFEQIKGFGSYGFPESHAASFAKLVYVSSWIKYYHPAVFACALLNAQPMGFYAPAQIVRDAQDHGVDVLPVDVNFSVHDCALERNELGVFALRLGFRMIDGIGEEVGNTIVMARRGGFNSIEILARRTRLPTRILRCLADADTMASLTLGRRGAIWAVRRLSNDVPLPLFINTDTCEFVNELVDVLPITQLVDNIVADYQTLGLSLKGHPMQFLRPLLQAEKVLSCAEILAQNDGIKVKAVGVVLVRQRPGKGNAIFITIEDETGVINVIVWSRLFEHFRRVVMSSRLMLVEGMVQKNSEGVVHLIAIGLYDLTAMLSGLSETHEAAVELARADEFLRPKLPRGQPSHPRNLRVLPRSRDFH